MTVRPNPSTRSVPQIFRTGHGAGHTGTVQDTLAAHLAIEDGALAQLFAPGDDSPPAERLALTTV